MSFQSLLSNWHLFASHRFLPKKHGTVTTLGFPWSLNHRESQVIHFQYRFQTVNLIPTKLEVFWNTSATRCRSELTTWMAKEQVMTARWPGPGPKKTVRTRMHSIVVLFAWLCFLTPSVFSYVNSFWSQLHFLFRLERLCVASDVRYRRRSGRVVRMSDLKSCGRGPKSHSDHLAGVVSRSADPRSTCWSCF